MKAELYLVVKAKPAGWKEGAWTHSSQKISKRKPATGPDEVLVRLNLDIPDMLFNKPALIADIVLPEPKNEMVCASMCDEIANLVQEEMGVKLHITLSSEDDT